MVLTLRDKTLLSQLSRYALMTTKQIQNAVFNGIAITTVLRRLRILEDAGYIQRIEGLANAEKAWTMTMKGCEETADRIPKRHFNRSTLPHDVKLADLRLALEGHGIAHSWIAEHEIRSQMARSHGISRVQGRNVPDGLMGIEYQGIKHSIAIELELNFKNQGRYKNIFENYHYKRNLWAVWYLVQSKSLGRHIDRLWMKRYGSSQSPFFMWSMADDVIAEPLNAIVYCNDESFRTGKVWMPKVTSAPAQDPAQGVSTRSEEKIDKQSSLTSRIENELPAKAV